MGELNPLKKVRMSISSLIGAMPEGDVKYEEQIRKVYLELEGAFNSRSFRESRESFAKQALLAKSQGNVHGVNLFRNIIESMRYWDRINHGIISQGVISFLDLVCLDSCLLSIEMYQQDMNRDLSNTTN